VSASWPSGQVVEVEYVEDSCDEKKRRADIKTSDSVITIAVHQRQYLLYHSLHTLTIHITTNTSSLTIFLSFCRCFTSCVVSLQPDVCVAFHHAERLQTAFKFSNERRRFVGHILRLPVPATRPASLAVEWIPEGGRRMAGRPMMTRQDTLKEDLQMMAVDWSEARDTASDHARTARWRQLVARCSTWNGRI